MAFYFGGATQRRRMASDSRDQKLRAVQAFLDGLVSKDVERMPLAADLMLTSPLDPEHPLIGKEAAAEFLRTRVFPRIPVHKAEVERHVVEGECVATLWNATFALPGNKRAVVPIFDFFRIVDGEIKEIRPYFDPKPLKEAPAQPTQKPLREAASSACRRKRPVAR
jgi:predicted SnoaL-like aldol condensation-catalyzing enzyme